MTELLAPVGSREALIAAISAGADAVYLGGKLFGARQYAPNFDDEELSDAVRLAHLYGVSVFVTVNTLLDNDEMPQLVQYLKHLYQIGADAIIVQDVGVADVARKVVPDLPIHSSTQMTVHNLAGVKFMAEHGISRVVFARELSLQDIRTITSESPIEIEVFIHGALCICYSGQCLMSSMIGGRSGNRGRCAQPCRLPYSLLDQDGNDVLRSRDAGEYLLSPKDFNTMELLPELISAGVASFKIEGRMKRPEYVSVVVDTYRRAIDAANAAPETYKVAAKDQKDLAQIFNRGFTTAYLKTRPGRMMMSDRRPNNRGVRTGRVLRYDGANRTAVIKLDEPLYLGDILEFWVKVGGRSSATIHWLRLNGQEAAEAPAGAEVEVPVQDFVRPNDRVFKTFDARLMERARAFFAGQAVARKIPVDVSVTVAEGHPLVISLRDAEGYEGEGATEFKGEPARKRPLTEEVIAKQVGRLGTTAFELRQLDCRIAGAVMVPVSEINEARRKAVEALEASRLSRYARPALSDSGYRIEKELTLLRGNKRKPGRPALIVNLDTPEKAEQALYSGADGIVFGGERLDHKPISPDDYRNVLNSTRRLGKQIVFSLPRLVKDSEMPGIARQLELFRELRPDGISVGNPGTLYLARQVDLPLYGDYPLNVYNSLALRFYRDEGISCITLSPELTFNQVERMTGMTGVKLECLVHGYLTLMISEYCAMGSFLGDIHQGNCSQPCLGGKFLLKDRMGETFPVLTDQYCRMHILNAKELSMFAHIPRFAEIGIDRLRIEGKAVAASELARTVKLYREIIDQGDRHPLLLNNRVDSIEHENVTRGHYFRGVL